MNIRITDLLDQYEDHTVTLQSNGAEKDHPGAAGLKTRRHSFGWRESLAAAAALAVIVGCGFLLHTRLQRNVQPLAEPEGPSSASEALPSDAPLTSSPEHEAWTDTDPTIEAPAPEPDGWEEEFPQEYPVTKWLLEGGAGQVFAQTGVLNKYRYEKLQGAEDYVTLLQSYADEALGSSVDFVPDLDTAHDGYCNWFLQTDTGSASVSGSDLTGRFCFNLWPGTERASKVSVDPLDVDSLLVKARAFADRFTGLTGELEYVSSKVDYDQYYPDQADTPDIRVRTLTCYFRSTEYSRIQAQMQDGYDVPVLCGDSEIEDPSQQLFTVTLWPDGTVVTANNYLTRAALELDSTCPMLTEAAMPQLVSFFTSFVEDDTMVVTKITADCYNVYFGSAEADPTLSITYYYASDPDMVQTTQIIAEGLLN